MYSHIKTKTIRLLTFGKLQCLEEFKCIIKTD